MCRLMAMIELLLQCINISPCAQIPEECYFKKCAFVCFHKGRRIQFLIFNAKTRWEPLNDSTQWKSHERNINRHTADVKTQHKVCICNLAVSEPAKGGQCASTLTCNAVEEAAGWHHGFWWVVLRPLPLTQHPSEWKQRERWGGRQGGMNQCINIKPIHLSSQVHAATWSTEGTAVCSHRPPPPLSSAAITTSKRLLYLQGRLCCAWRRFLFQVIQRAVCYICNDRVCQVQCYYFRGVRDS